MLHRLASNDLVDRSMVGNLGKSELAGLRHRKPKNAFITDTGFPEDGYTPHRYYQLKS